MLYDRSAVSLKLTFTDQFTNRTVAKELFVAVYDSKHKVTINKRILSYHPGSPFTTRLKVTYQNDEPAENVTLQVVTKGPDDVYRQNCTSNRNGDITFSMQTNKSTVIDSFQVFDGNISIARGWFKKVDGADLLEDKFIKVELLTRVKFNRMIKLLVTCSHNMTILLYYVISKENVVGAGFFRPNQTNRYSFQLLMSEQLIPRSKIIIVTIVSKSLIFDDVDLSIDEFGNPLEIKIEENIGEDGVDPGDEIELGIRGRPGAFVALAAYDQRLMQQNQDVSQIFFHDISFANVWNMFATPYDRNMIFPHSSKAKLGIFAVVANDTNRIPGLFEYGSRGILPDAPRLGMPGPYRTDFCESWLWQNLTIPSSGRFELITAVPHSATSWYITGISIDPKYGLGIVKKAATFSTVRILFILDHLPPSIKRGETILLHFTLFSNLTDEFEATVTMSNPKGEINFIDRPAADKSESKIVAVPPSSDTPVSFLVQAMKLGELEIRLNASVMQGIISDSFKKIIMVHPEDIVVLRSKQMHFDRDTPSDQSFDIPLFTKKKAKNTSIQLDLTVYPDRQSLKVLQNTCNLSLHYDGFDKSIQINSNIKQNITIKSIPNYVRHVSVIVACSSAQGVIKINWQYRLNLIHFEPRFNLQITKLGTSSKWMKQLNICCNFVPRKTNNYSNSTLVEVSIPIGYAMDSHNVVEETTINPISRIEILHGGTTLQISYNHIGDEMTCFSVFVYRRYNMPIKRPLYIKVQDIFRPELNAVQVFNFH
ncbi:uncharacterized protein LOC118458749 isoform X1 [Anopheles albimanus]|nr:uncharacterized protein LOC118458749 isoform X1 [Anopheles albimanus]